MINSNQVILEKNPLTNTFNRAQPHCRQSELVYFNISIFIAFLTNQTACGLCTESRNYLV